MGSTLQRILTALATMLKACQIGAILLAVGCSGEAERLEVQFAGMCPVGWQDRPAPFGDGRIGVNTVFRSTTRQSTVDRNILDLYFFDVASERANPPQVTRGAEYVWAVETHDTDDRYRYRPDGVRVCWRVR